MAMNFSEFRSWFDERFSLLLQQKIDVFAAHSESAAVREISEYLTPLAANGKRFRPFLVYLASGVDRDTAEHHKDLFFAVELLHLFALIHDDIMDEADTRHGVTCAHKQFDAQYGATVGEAIGILLGDIVFAWTYECLMAYTQQYPATSERIQKEFTTLVSEVTHGQILDVLSPVQEPLSKEDIIQKMILKTARYSFVQPIALGYAAGGIPRDDFVDSFGVAVGIGFQLQDDLLDVVPSSQSGKTSFVDIQAGQQTLLSWYMRSVATDNDRAAFENYSGNTTMSDEEKKQCATLLDSAGAVAYVTEQIKEYFATAQQMIDLHKQSDNKCWQEIMDLVVGRKK